MKTFKTFVGSARMKTREDVLAFVAHHISQGEILNPAYVDLNTQAKRVFQMDSAVGVNIILGITRGAREDLEELYYDWPTDSMTALGKFEKTLAKTEASSKKPHPSVFANAHQLLSDWKSIAADIKTLKSRVVKVTQKRAEEKAVVAKEMGKRFTDSSTLIDLFESHLGEYKARARQTAKEYMDTRIKVLSDAAWDLNKVAPNPARIRLSREDYKTAAAKRAYYTTITSSKKTNQGRNEPDIRELRPAMVDLYLNGVEREAEAAYRGFMAKMILKIGSPVVQASMTGNIWNDAKITVKTVSGEEQVWHTKMIINFSKYGKFFNQFPTRRKT